MPEETSVEHFTDNNYNNYLISNYCYSMTQLS